VAGVGYGPCALFNIKLSDGSLLLKGKRVCSTTNAEECAMQTRTIIPFNCENRLTQIGAIFSGAGPFEDNVVVDGRVITGQNTASATSVAKAVVTALSKYSR
jgi:putative intracellular protease/amidase